MANDPARQAVRQALLRALVRRTIMSRQGTERTKRRRAIRDYYREGPGADDANAGDAGKGGSVVD